MNFFKNITIKAIFRASMTFAVRVRNQVKDTKVYCHCFCFRWTPKQETFLSSLFSCGLQTNKSNFFDFPSKLVTVRGEIAKPKVNCFNHLCVQRKKCFLTTFILAVFQVNKGHFLCPLPLIRYCQGVSRT